MCAYMIFVVVVVFDVVNALFLLASPPNYLR